MAKHATRPCMLCSCRMVAALAVFPPQAALRDVEQQEERFLEHVNEAWDAACAHAEERAVVYAQMRHARGQLEVLERAHAYRDLFHIWAEGPFGTISGLRYKRGAWDCY